MDVLCEREGPLGKEQAPINLGTFPFCLTSEQRVAHCILSFSWDVRSMITIKTLGHRAPCIV